MLENETKQNKTQKNLTPEDYNMKSTYKNARRIQSVRATSVWGRVYQNLCTWTDQNTFPLASVIEGTVLTIDYYSLLS